MQLGEILPASGPLAPFEPRIWRCEPALACTRACVLCVRAFAICMCASSATDDVRSQLCMVLRGWLWHSVWDLSMPTKIAHVPLHDAPCAGVCQGCASCAFSPGANLQWR